MKIFQLVVTLFVAKFFPDMQFVGAYPVSPNLTRPVLTEAAELHAHHSVASRLNACGQVVQLAESGNPVFSSLARLVPIIAEDASYRMEKRCVRALWVIMSQVKMRPKKASV